MPKLMVNGTNLSSLQTDPNTPSASSAGSNALVDIPRARLFEAASTR